tara:strand:- start:4422 stop:4700 length:279 start_codon:yes stop_codon:yes gene_type:complete
MALLMNVTRTDIGVGFSEAYARVHSVQVVNHPRRGISVNVEVLIYATQTARTEKANAVARVGAIVEMPSGDFLPGIYAALKKLPEFEGAIDC